MNEPTLQKIQAELSDRLTGQKFGKIFVLTRNRIVIDFRLADGSYLFIGVEPNSPRAYLIKRRLKTLEKQSGPGPPFFSQLRKHLANAVVRSIEKFAGERVLKLVLYSRNELGEDEHYRLVIQLTGRSSNLFLLDEKEKILESLRNTAGDGQISGSLYAPPDSSRLNPVAQSDAFPQGSFDSLSEALDEFYSQKEIEEAFKSKANAAKGGLNKKIKKKTRLRKRLEADLVNHGDPEKWKHFGEVLLANVATARRAEDKFIAIDYFAPDSPEIEIEADENHSVTEAAENCFRLYSKARNARSEISKRMAVIQKELAQLESRKEQLIQAINARNLESVEGFLKSDAGAAEGRQKSKSNDPFPGTKRYSSSDGFEILVGKRSKDNDFLTFRIAKSLDTWLHAADYPGSHVVIRNPNRKEIPRTTLLEAAGLAAFYSKAKNEAKAAVHYTQKKFVNKPKGAAPGLVSLASFKTVVVRPGIPGK